MPTYDCGGTCVIDCPGRGGCIVDPNLGACFTYCRDKGPAPVQGRQDSISARAADGSAVEASWDDLEGLGARLGMRSDSELEIHASGMTAGELVQLLSALP
jgi:hypothetical protein